MPTARPNLKWYPERCKKCSICVTICPTKNLKLEDNSIIEIAKCSRCSLCVNYCPDQALSLKAQAKS